MASLAEKIKTQAEIEGLCEWMRCRPVSARAALDEMGIGQMADALEEGGIEALGALIHEGIQSQYEYEIEDKWGDDLAGDIDEAELDRRDRARDVQAQMLWGW